MRLSRNSLRSVLTPILVGAQALVLISCEPAQPTLVQRPKFSPDSTSSRYTAGTTTVIVLQAPDSSLVFGQQVKARGVPRNAKGLFNSAPVTYSVAPSNIATISSTGLITAGQTAGSATVIATADGVTATMPITVSSGTSTGTKAVALSLSATPQTIKQGQATQVSALVMYPSGTVMGGSPVVWSSQQPNIATISSTGLVKGLTIGTATIVAQADTAKSSIQITVIDSSGKVVTPPTTPPPAIPPGASGGSYGNATAAELPRVSVSTTYPSVSRQVRVPAGANLQAAINAAQPGDELLLAPGATYIGNFTLPNKGNGPGWVVIRTDAPDAAIGYPGTRMTPTRARSANLARIFTPTISSALITNLGASHYRITGVEISATSAVIDINALIRFGDSSPQQNTMALVAHDLVLDRAWVHGSSSLNMNRCVMLNSATSAVVDSWLADCHSNNGESQAIAGWNGPGPFLIQNNHLEAGHEVVVFGGGTMFMANQSPSDITLRGNHITRPASWKGVWQVKNLLETKHVKRLLVEGNVFENNWAGAQAGFAMVLKSENQNNDNPWTTSSDITVRYNKIRNTGNGINLAANPSGLPAIPAARIVITDNVFENINVSPYLGDGHTLQLLGGLSDIVMRHNTVTSANGTNAFAVVLGSLPVVQRLVVHSNVLMRGSYGIKGGGVGEGTASINLYSPGALVTNNVIVGATSQTPYPANNWFTSSLGNVLANLLGGNLSLNLSSQFVNKGYDGRDVGADINQVNAQTGGAVVPP